MVVIIILARSSALQNNSLFVRAGQSALSTTQLQVRPVHVEHLRQSSTTVEDMIAWAVSGLGIACCSCLVNVTPESRSHRPGSFLFAHPAASYPPPFTYPRLPLLLPASPFKPMVDWTSKKSLETQVAIIHKIDLILFGACLWEVRLISEHRIFAFRISLRILALSAQ